MELRSRVDLTVEGRGGELPARPKGRRVWGWPMGYVVAVGVGGVLVVVLGVLGGVYVRFGV